MGLQRLGRFYIARCDKRGVDAQAGDVFEKHWELDAWLAKLVERGQTFLVVC